MQRRYSCGLPHKPRPLFLAGEPGSYSTKPDDFRMIRLAERRRGAMPIEVEAGMGALRYSRLRSNATFVVARAGEN